MNRPGKLFYSNCKGGEHEVFFTKNDLIKAAVIKQKVDGLCFFEKKAFEVVDSHYDQNNPRAMIKYLEYNWQENRIERALFFLELARLQNYLPLKITLYIPILEALFSCSPIEVTHKVSEISAHYLGGSKQQKYETFDFITEVYNFRSKIIHGAALQNFKTHSEQEVTSEKTDKIVRKILLKAIMNNGARFSKEQNPVFTKWINSKVFGTKTPDYFAPDKKQQKKIKSKAG